MQAPDDEIREELLDEAIVRIQQDAPPEHAVREALSRVPLDTRVMDRVFREQTLKLRRRAMRKRYGLIAVSVAAAAALVAILLWPGGHGNGIVWADVVRQVREARTAHIQMTLRYAEATGGRETVIDIYMKAPDKSRTDVVRPEDLAQSTITNGSGTIVLNPSKKLMQVSTNAAGLPANMVEQLLTKEFAFPEAPAAGQSGDGSGSPGNLTKRTFVGIEKLDGRPFLRYRVEPADAIEGQQASSEVPVTYFWFDAADKTLARMTAEQVVNGKVTEVASAAVRLNVDLSDDLFSTEPPAGYRVMPETGMMFGASDELVDLSAKYEEAREQIQRYRLILWLSSKPLGPEGWYLKRSVRDGARWRVDGGACKRSDAELDFETAWQRIVVLPYGNITFTYAGRIATIRGLGIEPRAVWSDDSNQSRYRLSELGWPAWPRSMSLGLGEPEYFYQRLPDRPDRLGLIGVRIETNRRPPAGKQPTEQQQELSQYWIDPRRDYLCVHYENHRRMGRPWQGHFDWQPAEPETNESPKGTFSESDEVWEITAFGRTPDGHWYPKAVRVASASVVNGLRHALPPATYPIQLDVAGSIPDGLFEWPADVPMPN